MPAMVHDVLLAHGKIEEPWLPGGTEKCFWTGERDWVYALKFSARPGRVSRLRFLGLDGRSDFGNLDDVDPGHIPEDHPAEG